MKKSQLKEIIKEELNNILKEDFSVMTANFVKDLEKFLALQIKKGNIKNMANDDIDTHADVMYKALIANKGIRKGFKI